MNTYELYGADPVQYPDSRWHGTIRARSGYGAMNQAKRRLRGGARFVKSTYPRGYLLWYIEREPSGGVTVGNFEL